MSNNNQYPFLYLYNRNKQIVQNNDIINFDFGYGNNILNYDNDLNNFIITQNGLYKINYNINISSIFPVSVGLYNNNKLIPGSKYGNTIDNTYSTNVNKIIENLQTLEKLTNQYLEIGIIKPNIDTEKIITEMRVYLQTTLNPKFMVDVNVLRDTIKKYKTIIDQLDNPELFNNNTNNNNMTDLYSVYNTIVEIIKDNFDDIYNQILNPPVVNIIGCTYTHLKKHDKINFKNLSSYTITVPIIPSYYNPNAINANMTIEKLSDSCNINTNYYINNEYKNRNKN
jgi:hypothetical protein